MNTAANYEWLILLGIVLAIAIVELRSLRRARKSRGDPDRESPNQDPPP